MTVVKFNIKNSNVNFQNASANKIFSEKNIIFFSKFELTAILNLYSKQVSKGSWRDYALDSEVDTAIFSIYRHSHDKPLYQIIKKSQRGFRNKPEFSIKSDLYVMNKSNELSTILSKFEKKLCIIKYKI